jgi:hypothetical protein
VLDTSGYSTRDRDQRGGIGGKEVDDTAGQDLGRFSNALVLENVYQPAGDRPVNVSSSDVEPRTERERAHNTQLALTNTAQGSFSESGTTKTDRHTSSIAEGTDTTRSGLVTTCDYKMQSKCYGE